MDTDVDTVIDCVKARAVPDGNRGTDIRLCTDAAGIETWFLVDHGPNCVAMATVTGRACACRGAAIATQAVAGGEDDRNSDVDADVQIDGRGRDTIRGTDTIHGTDTIRVVETGDAPRVANVGAGGLSEALARGQGAGSAASWKLESAWRSRASSFASSSSLLASAVVVASKALRRSPMMCEGGFFFGGSDAKDCVDGDEERLFAPRAVRQSDRDDVRLQEGGTKGDNGSLPDAVVDKSGGTNANRSPPRSSCNMSWTMSSNDDGTSTESWTMSEHAAGTRAEPLVFRRSRCKAGAEASDGSGDISLLPAERSPLSSMLSPSPRFNADNCARSCWDFRNADSVNACGVGVAHTSASSWLISASSGKIAIGVGAFLANFIDSGARAALEAWRNEVGSCPTSFSKHKSPAVAGFGGRLGPATHDASVVMSGDGGQLAPSALRSSQVVTGDGGPLAPASVVQVAGESTGSCHLQLLAPGSVMASGAKGSLVATSPLSSEARELATADDSATRS
mmetsp:Transcript_108020/g.304326  ORF Transcript_108020/g.304326 Transcript_108020/m.304326 type:complete len:510 (-) Transcript_108020:297-1826(-)